MKSSHSSLDLGAEPAALASAPDQPDNHWYARLHGIPPALAKLCEQRARLEAELSERYTSRIQAAEAACREQLAAVQARHAQEIADIQTKTEAALVHAREQYKSACASTRSKRAAREKEIEARHQSNLEDARNRQEQARWEAAAIFESNDRAEVQRSEAFEKDLAVERETFSILSQTAHATLGRLRPLAPPATPSTSQLDPPANTPPTLDSIRELLSSIDQQLLALIRLKLPKIVTLPGTITHFLALLALSAGLLIWQLGWPTGIIAAIAVTLLLTIPARILCARLARNQLAQSIPRVTRDLSLAQHEISRALDDNRTTHAARRKHIREERDRTTREADLKLREALAAAESERSDLLAEIARKATERLQSLESEHKRLVEAANTHRANQLRHWNDWKAAEELRIQTELDTHRREAEARKLSDWNTLLNLWNNGLSAIRAKVESLQHGAAATSLDWNLPAQQLTLAREVPPAFPFGSVHVDLARIPHGLSKNEQLRNLAGPGWHVPALLTFPDRASLLVRATGDGKTEAIKILQGTMLRFLTSLPPGKVRFTLLDPVGLGRNFAAFMHLADYSELLVNSRIWTEPAQIDQRLADLSLHMENVIQQFLRNEFATLEEYNRQAAEVAEPYRVLVVAHFPAQFQESSAHRLMSIATGGARCGVHTLILVDEDQPLPATFKLEELESHAHVLIWNQHARRFAWKQPEYAPFDLTPDLPPPDDTLTPLLHRVGEAARHANRVEVPFEVIAPRQEAWWKGDTSHTVEIPLGRAGATKLQALHLGRGTSQHALIAGRTGSGKSTLLHALVTNASLIYSPDQIEFYLIDFKKGVEFKTYAEHALPHARVVAIESEREFGVSVLQRLDDELRRRGELFRALNVQDLPAYRSSDGTTPLPRLLLIVDEFQEFFVEDDKLAQEAALLLDRLVRQGRAFGIHVILGSQTLGGAFSLARSTLGQMAIRIALQCSESDAHLILSEDNSAARLLTRPGEAIYNDANGMVEGNHVFQVVWLPETTRTSYLDQLMHKAASLPPKPQIVFEGNVPSDLRRNLELARRLNAPDWSDPPRAPCAWLGEAVAIKDPTAAVFRRQGGNNLLMIGQDSDSARGIIAASLFSLAAQLRPDQASFVLLDGTPDDSADAETLSSLARDIPHPFQSGTTRDAATLLASLASELKSRQNAGRGGPSIFVVLFDAARFRDLRRSDDFSYGFGSSGDEPKANPAEHFAELIREGPALGIHLIVWCDTLNNLQRVVDRASMREFEMRVLFQMSANDSTSIIDTPLANRLGVHRALFASEERGTLEKFRPYQLPPADWLQSTRTSLAARPV